MPYKLTNTSSIIRIEDGATIPADYGNEDYLEYLIWLNGGNTPLPADPLPNPLIALAITALAQTDGVAGRCFKAGVAYPSEWASYTGALRAIVNGSDTASVSLPSKPAYPAGT